MASCSIPAKEAKDENETKTVPNWLELPKDITVNILKRLDTIEIVTSACLVCPLWWNICKDPLMWQTICMIDNDNYLYNFTHLDKICRYAVERSSGHLESIYVECFATDDLLKYIADNANELQHMRLVRCGRISDKGLSEAVRKLPQLVALDISLCNLSKDSLEVVGRSCPLLKLLKFVRTGFGYFGGDVDDEAFVIAETMSGLSHLIIKGHKLTNVGLIAILDKCPHLEFLDIQRCYNLDLNESLRKRCQEQIKDLRLSTVRNTYEDYEDYDDHVSYRDSVIDDDCYDPYD